MESERRRQLAGASRRLLPEAAPTLGDPQRCTDGLVSESQQQGCRIATGGRQDGHHVTGPGGLHVVPCRAVVPEHGASLCDGRSGRPH